MFAIGGQLDAIAKMESQIENMRESVAALRGKPIDKKPKKVKKEKPAPVASSSKTTKPPKIASAPNGGGGGGGGNKRKGKKPVGDDDVLTFEQKKDLSEAIQTLDGQKLERVIAIIHEGVPEIRDVRFSVFFGVCGLTNARRARKKSSWRSTCFPQRC